MAACWRELARREGVELLVIALGKDASQTVFDYDATVLEGFNCRLIASQGPPVVSVVSSEVEAFNPDIIFICGWGVPAYVQLLRNGLPSRTKKVMTMDTNLERDWRQFLAPFRIGGFLKAMDCLFVPGERSWQLARYWGIPEARIRRGSYSMDYRGFAQALEIRNKQTQWPKRFLFAGQYIVRKGITELIEAYSAYRKLVDDPWPLTCCGAGPLRSLLDDVPGVTDNGFAQPDELPATMAAAGVFLHPSLYDRGALQSRRLAPLDFRFCVLQHVRLL